MLPYINQRELSDISKALKDGLTHYQLSSMSGT